MCFCCDCTRASEDEQCVRCAQGYHEYRRKSKPKVVEPHKAPPVTKKRTCFDCGNLASIIVARYGHLKGKNVFWCPHCHQVLGPA